MALADADALTGSATLGQLIITAVARFGDRPALSDGVNQWTYGQLGEAISKIVAALTSLGVRKGQGLAMLVGNRVEQVACQYAAVLMGLRYTALHPLSAPESHAFILDDAKIAVLVLEPALVTPANAGFWSRSLRRPTVVSLGPLEGAVDLLAAMDAADPAPLRDEADPEAPPYLLYTGGTTGVAKGVILSHRAMVAVTLLQAADWDLPKDLIRFLAAAPATHASGVVIPTVFMQGGYVRLVRGFDPGQFCELVREERINMTFLVPSMIYVLLEHPGLGEADLSSLETVMYGAAPISPARLAEAIRRIGPVFVQLYGQTEAPMVIATLRKSDHENGDPGRLASCGLPAASVQVKLLRADLSEAAAGEPGEICVRGPIVMDGYWNRPEATAEAFHGAWLHTGDVAVRDASGFLTIVDRTKDMIISGGFNIYPREVEDVLLEHPDVASAAVIGAPNEKWGEAVTAYVVLRAGRHAKAADLTAHVRQRRGAIWAPKSVLFVDAIPLTPLGKVDRKALRAAWSHPIAGAQA